MKLKDWLKKWEMNNLTINAHFLQLELKFNVADKKAAWELYVELLTRITTQYLEPEHGDENTALSSIHKIFELTREILKKYGSQSIEFAKIAIVVLNQVIRPFTAKWHKLSNDGAFKNKEKCDLFRSELSVLQIELRKYTKMLSGICEVEDLTIIEKEK